MASASWKDTNSANFGAPPNKKSKSDGHRGVQSYKDIDQFLERSDSKLPPNHIILISIINIQYPINVEVIYKVCAISGKVRKIVCFDNYGFVKAMVEFETLESADKARSSLHGCDIYDNCCTMKVEYSKMQNLTVKDNGPLSWDFTNSNEPTDKRPVILNRPDMDDDTMRDHSGMQGRPGVWCYGVGSGGENNTMNPMVSKSANVAANFMKMVPNLLASAGGANVLHSGSRHDMIARSFDGEYGHVDYERTCVVMVYGLDSEKWNPLLLFNLICQYGNVNKIFFMKNKESTAMVEMGEAEGVDNIIKFIPEVHVFGDKVRFDISRKHKKLTVTPTEHELVNGSPSIRDFSREKHMNRFVRQELAKKNRILKPTKVLHFYNVIRVPDHELISSFQDNSAPQPINIKWSEPKEGSRVTGSSGLLYFDSVDDCTDALVLINHAKVGERNIKLGYSPAKY